MHCNGFPRTYDHKMHVIKHKKRLQALEYSEQEGNRMQPGTINKD